MVTVASSGLPSDTSSGSAPKPSSTESLSSSASSAAAVNVKVCDVSSDSKVTLVGTPE